MTAGYSGTPLAKKLGLKAGMKVCFINAPDDFDTLLGAVPDNIIFANELSDHDYDMVHYFAASADGFTADFPALKSAITKNGMLWVSWLKQGSGRASDMNENVIRDLALDHGLVDVKVCAVDADWSALKLVWRKENR